MADQGTFDLWITDRLTFSVMPPLADETGDFDRWLTDRLAFGDYAETQVEAVTPVSVNISPDANYVQVV